MKEEEFPPVYHTSDIVDAVFQDRYGPDHPLADCKFVTLEDHKKVIANMAPMDDVRYNFENFYDQRELAKAREEECERLRKNIADKEHSMCDDIAKVNTGIDATQAFYLAVDARYRKVLSKIEDVASEGGLVFVSDEIVEFECPVVSEVVKRLNEHGFNAELDTQGYTVDRLVVKWDNPHTNQPNIVAATDSDDDKRIKPLKKIKDLPESTWALEDDKRMWSIKQWHDHVVELNGMISFLQSEQTKMQNKMNQITIENTWLEADSYKIPFNRHVVACLEDEQLVVGVLTKPGEFIIQYVIDPRNDTKINDVVIKQWKYATWPKP